MSAPATPAGADGKGGAGGIDTRTRLRAVLSATTARLGAAAIVSASVDARALIGAAARAEGPFVMIDVLPSDFDEVLEGLVARRAAREPLQLILGAAPFRRLELETAPGVFVPRPETEVAIDVLLATARTERMETVVDLCTGSGALAAAVLDELPASRVVAVEIDPAAAELAARNLARAAGEAGASRGERWEVRRADVADAGALADLRGVDAVVSNPPYIPPHAVPRDAEVAAWDPERALYGGGADGLDVPRAVVARAAELLRPGGLLVMEHADEQGPSTRAIARDHGGLADVRTVRDLTGRDRFLVARRAGAAPPGIAGSGTDGGIIETEVGD
ncbi:peptide chain release factor N(5)-glutamine methyltransferase [Brachybacterium huguangmaarense]